MNKKTLSFVQFKKWLTEFIVNKEGEIPDYYDWVSIKEMLDRVNSYEGEVTRLKKDWLNKFQDDHNTQKRWTEMYTQDWSMSVYGNPTDRLAKEYEVSFEPETKEKEDGESKKESSQEIYFI